MKNIPLILILVLTACSSPTDKQMLDNSVVKVASTATHDLKDSLRTSGEREYIDSAHFSIIRGNYVSGGRFIEVYQNKLTKLDNWKEFHESGKLKKEGKMTNGNNIPVGIWNYYAENGKLDSSVNHDLKYKISYFKALEISEQKGYKMPDIEVTLTDENQKIYWQIARWKESEDNGSRTADLLLIDTNTGKVSKPAYQLTAVY